MRLRNDTVAGIGLLLLPFAVLSATTLPAAELLVGGATVSITPDQPVALDGQMYTRIAEEVESPVTATALALESRDGDEVVDQAILVSCDLVAIRQGLIQEVRERLGDRLPGFDLDKLILNATHTHTGPVTQEGRYELPDEGIMPPEEYRAFLVDRLVEVVVDAWEAREPGLVGWGLGHAVVGQNRRPVYADGRAQMYGPTDRDDFRGIEGYEDHGIEVLFFWNTDEDLIATAINVAGPSQAVEHRSAVNADFWHETRELLRERYGPDLLVLGWTGAAGDQSPRPMYRKAAEERMRTLRGRTELDELAHRLVAAWEDAIDGARHEKHADAVLIHKVREVELPLRKVTEAEYAEAKKEVASLADSDEPRRQWQLRWHQSVIDRYEEYSDNTVYPMELHVIRLGDVAIATNDFELFTEFGVQIKARSKAIQTFIIQLAGPGSYLPTERAVQGGSYSAIVQSSRVGPEGGQVLVDETVALINSLWPSEEP